MRPFIVHTGVAAVLPIANLDTDAIVRVERLVSLRPGQFGRYAFESLRYSPDGSENPDFILNQLPWRDASILLCGANFGCGSSREAAVWALADFGIRVLIGTDFGDIFAANCLQNGLPVIRLTANELAALEQQVQARPDHRLRVDLRGYTISTLDGEHTQGFAFDAFWQDALLRAADQIERTLQFDACIRAFARAHQARMPWLYDSA